MLRKIITAAGLCAALSTPALAQDLSSMSWDQVVAQAKSEGQLTWYNWYFQPQFRTEVKAFEDKYGIKVNIPDVTSSSAALKKVIAEAGRETGDIDVLSEGGAAGLTIDPSKYLTQILPELPDRAHLTGAAEGVDWKGYAVKFWGNQTGMIYDSNRVSLKDLPQTLPDLEKWMEANPGQLGFNYENGGSGTSFIGNISRNVLGLDPKSDPQTMPDMTPVHDWFHKYQNDYVLTASNADSLSRLASGEFLLVPGWEDMLAGQIKNGEVGSNLKIYIPEWGMNGGGNVVTVPKNAPHPAAALLFISWLTSAEEQTSLNANFGSAPANTDADDSHALISNVERANTRSWIAPLKNTDIVKDVVENVFEY